MVHRGSNHFWIQHRGICFPSTNESDYRILEPKYCAIEETISNSNMFCNDDKQESRPNTTTSGTMSTTLGLQSWTTLCCIIKSNS
ncbi:hypothetical protein LINPERHAP1_LOCUS17503 [Linum perenne]